MCISSLLPNTVCLRCKQTVLNSTVTRVFFRLHVWLAVCTSNILLAGALDSWFWNDLQIDRDLEDWHTVQCRCMWGLVINHHAASSCMHTMSLAYVGWQSHLCHVGLCIKVNVIRHLWMGGHSRTWLVARDVAAYHGDESASRNCW